VFVPASRMLRMADLREGAGPGSRLHDSDMYRAPLMSYAPLTFVVPMLGAAQHEVMRCRPGIVATRSVERSRISSAALHAALRPGHARRKPGPVRAAGRVPCGRSGRSCGRG
jgi:hypothetical protein